MTTVDEVFAALREFPSVSERGTAFEKLMVRFLTEDRVFADRFTHVCRWDQWEHNGGRVDTGIDLVAQERVDGSWTAIQCKFYEPTTTLTKAHLDSFFTESGRTFTTGTGTHSFGQRMIISTTDKWTNHAEEALEHQAIPVQRLGAADLADSSVNWDVVYPGAGALPSFDLTARELFEPRTHQQTAIDKIMAGFNAHDRGKLIMACGTGKTFTALRLAETLAESLGGRARILFLVPSISLLSQSLKEWHAQAKLPLRSAAVCSDTKVNRAVEDIATYDLEIPVTTDGVKLAEKLSHSKRAAGLTVVFSTYQSLPVINRAQEAGVDTFDLVICDEAHRTTGITVDGQDSSNFVKIHEDDFIRATKRLYMTATPRLFDDSVKDKAADHSAEVASMDDEAIYGPEFHRLGFGEAVEKGLLTDYKVLVLTVDQQVAARTTANIGGEIALDDVAQLIGCYNGLAKRSGTAADTKYGFTRGEAAMKRAVAFAKDIRTSTKVAENLSEVARAYSQSLLGGVATGDITDETNLDLQLQAEHVDGTMNALTRGDKLRWVKAPIPDNTCRVLTNARCLSEGVDVPALDAVMFLNPRNSVVDVVQSVGRVMRKAEGKDYGYIILPVAIPEGVSPSAALRDNRRFRVVWQVLNALRAHDDRFNAIVNSAALNTTTQDPLPGTPAPGENGVDASLADKLQVDHIGLGDATGDEPVGDADREQQSQQYALFSLEQWQEAIYTRIVDKVGDRTYWEDWADDVADIAAAQVTRITDLVDHADEKLAAEFDRFVEGLRANLNESITDGEAISMLSQHLITAPVFDALFAESNFASQNPVSKVMTQMITALDDAQLESETEGLEKFYRSVRVRAQEVTSAAGKQQVIKDLYERFFKKAFRKQADALGIVYTPVPIVDFILRAADDALRLHLGRSLSDEGVHVQDPFTGTGTFIVRLLQSGLISPEDLARKYASELWATEIMLLAYYVAAVNIEVTYNGLVAERAARGAGAELDAVSTPKYAPFDGIVLGDTFQMSEKGDVLDLNVFVDNNERAVRQLGTKMRVIVGNPPYSVGQKSANDLNANLQYPTIDKRISETYAGLSTGANKNSLYDSYYRAFRWATDRITQSGDGGVVAFVTNGGWIDGNSAEGVRLSFQKDFNHVYVYNLRGNSRTSGDVAKREGGNAFNIRVGVAVFVGVVVPGMQGCTVHYRDVGDYLTAEEKLDQVSRASIADGGNWNIINPNPYGDWLSQRSDEFSTFPAIGDKKKPQAARVFDVYSGGLKTNRDVWVYNYNSTYLAENVRKMLDTYNLVRAELKEWIEPEGKRSPGKKVDLFLSLHVKYLDPNLISWNSGLKVMASRNSEIDFSSASVTWSAYRPFSKRNVYFNSQLNERTYRLPIIFPTPNHHNIGIELTSAASHYSFTPFSTNMLPDLHLLDTGQFFPRFWWEPVATNSGELDLQVDEVSSGEDSIYGRIGEIVEGYRRIDNITDEITADYRNNLGADVSRDDIFHYVYGILHDPEYRETYAADLRKMLPHIETPTDRERFDHVVRVGQQLLDLHVNYEDADPYPLEVEVKKTVTPSDRETWRVEKMKWAKVRDQGTGKMTEDRSRIIYNRKVTITGIPLAADDYMLGSRSALAWIIDQYQVKTDKASGIVNDPNAWADQEGNPRYIVELIQKVTTVSVETMRLVGLLNQS
ncbi:MAG: DEAD/DEAH box helicase [Corynebacterium variabile]